MAPMGKSVMSSALVGATWIAVRFLNSYGLHIIAPFLITFMLAAQMIDPAYKFSSTEIKAIDALMKREKD